MAKYVDMSGFDGFTDSLEEFINKQGFTLGEDAERLEKLLHSIDYCYVNGVVTDSQLKQMAEKYNKLFEKAIHEKE